MCFFHPVSTFISKTVVDTVSSCRSAQCSRFFGTSSYQLCKLVSFSAGIKPQPDLIELRLLQVISSLLSPKIVTLPRFGRWADEVGSRTGPSGRSERSTMDGLSASAASPAASDVQQKIVLFFICSTSYGGVAINDLRYWKGV
jgi:hypothetical protein